MLVLLAHAAHAADEAAVSTGVYATAEICARCLAQAGMDPQYVGPAAVLLAVALRPAMEAASRHVWPAVAARFQRPPGPPPEPPPAPPKL
jgi:hypothetical protein